MIPQSNVWTGTTALRATRHPALATSKQAQYVHIVKYVEVIFWRRPLKPLSYATDDAGRDIMVPPEYGDTWTGVTLVARWECGNTATPIWIGNTSAFPNRPMCKRCTKNRMTRFAGLAPTLTDDQRQELEEYRQHQLEELLELRESM